MQSVPVHGVVHCRLQQVRYFVMLSTSRSNSDQSAIFVIFRRSWGLLFNDDTKVVTLVSSLLPLVALSHLGDGVSACTAGILRARGRQGTGALLNMSAYYVLGIPFGLYLAFIRSWGLFGMWIGLTLALTCTSFVGLWLCLSTDWQHEVHRSQARIEREQEGSREDDEMDS